MKILLAIDGSAYTKKMLAYLATHIEMFGPKNQFALINAQPPLPPRARAAVGAYEAAYAMTVPPAVIAANRTLLAALVATNFFGQNSPAIAATEAHYSEMWAQDAAAMYGYAASSAAASTLTPLRASSSASSSRSRSWL